MFRLWAKIWKDNHLIMDTVICNAQMDLTRTKKIFQAIDTACDEFNISHPIWFESTKREFIRFNRVRFGKDNYIEEIEFDYFEIHVIEEDEYFFH